MSEPFEDDELPSDVVDALRRGRKSEAVTRLRDARGLDAKTARAIVERHAAVTRTETGLTGPDEGPGIGWVVTLVAIIAILYALYTYAS